MKSKTFKTSLVLLASVSVTALLLAGPLTMEDVGDVDSFGHAALYMGASSGFIQMDPACTPPASPTPSDVCVTLNPAPAATSFTSNEVCRIALPKKATKTIIYPALNFFLNYQLQNTTLAAAPNALFSFTATLSIESPALTDPSVIDPGTGLPAGGVITQQFSYAYRDDRTMQIGDRQRFRMTLVRVGNAGINKAGLVAQGIPAAVVDAMFNGPMTVKMNVTGTERYVTDASLTCNMRLFGD